MRSAEAIAYEPFPDDGIEFAPPAPPSAEWLTRTPWYCTLPTYWPDPNVSDPRKPQAPTCWTEFATEEEREAHFYAEHAEWMKEVERPRNPAIGRSPVAEVEVDPEPTPGGPPRQDRVVDPASPRQLAFIESLAERKAKIFCQVVTKRQASDEIDRLNAFPDAQPFRRNKYDAPCSECGNTVPAGEGALRKDEQTGRWIVGHVSCPDEPNLPTKIENGHYAVSAEAGHTSFYRIVNGNKPGVVFVDLLVGGGPNGAFVRQSVARDQREGVLAKIAEAGIEEAALRFRQEAGRCVRCGRGLSNKVSREQMYGPECIKRV